MGHAYGCSVDLRFIAIISSYSILSAYLLSSLKKGKNIKVLLTWVDDTLENWHFKFKLPQIQIFIIDILKIDI